MQFIDTHSHLYSSQFDEDRTQVVAAAIAEAVSALAAVAGEAAAKEAAAEAEALAQREVEIKNIEDQISEKETATEKAVEVDDYDLAEVTENERQELIKQLEELKNM